MKKASIAVALLVLSDALLGAERITNSAEQELARAWGKIDTHLDNQGVRELFGFALEAVALGWHPERVESALDQAAELQDRDVASKTHGNFRWYRDQPRPQDLNAVEFCMQQGVLLWNLHREALTPTARTTLEALLRESIAGIRSHQVAVSYTNIFLMKTWNCIAIGETLHEPELTALGTRMLDEWFAYTRINGIHEFLSPTYSGVDCDSLALLRRFAQASVIRKKAEIALRLIYTQSAANWFAPSQRLGGAHSRDYDYLTGHGSFDTHLADWGWVTHNPGPLHEFLDLTRWVPESPVPELPTPRFVWQRWGDTAGAYASTYVGHDFCLGSAGAAYNSDDKVLTMQFPGKSATVMGNFVMDGRGDPYGHNKESVGGGHSKALHLIPFIASVQDGADVLFAASFDPKQKINKRNVAPTRQLAANLVLPAEAEVWSGNTCIVPTGAESVALAPDRPVFIRSRGVVLAMRVLEATDCAGRPVTARYFTDGAAMHAARICWLQSVGPAKAEAHVVFWLHSTEGLDDSGFAHLRATFVDISASAEISVGKLKARVTRQGEPLLEIEADLRTEERRVTPSRPGTAILMMNGQSLLERAGIEL